MLNSPTTLVKNRWDYCNILWDDSRSFGDYVEHLSLLPSPNNTDDTAARGCRQSQFSNLARIFKGMMWRYTKRLSWDSRCLVAIVTIEQLEQQR